jgi:hypothetical protein
MLFPAPATKGESHQSRRENNGQGTTDVSRESKDGNSVETLSIARMCRPEGTTLRSLRGANHRRYYGFSTDQEERAIPGHSALTYHLPKNLRSSSWKRQQFNITDVSICSFRLQLVASFLSLN